MIDNKAEKIEFSYNYDDTNINMSFNIDATVEDCVEYFKRFLLALGYGAKNVNEIRYGDEDMVIIKDRIKTSLETLELLPNRDEDNISRVIQDLNEAYDY